MDPYVLRGEPLRPLRRAEYDYLVASGAFEDQHVELLRGWLVEMSPQGGAHARLTARIHKHLLLALGERAEVRSHSPFAASDISEPEPDVQVIPPSLDDALPEDAILLVEVAVSSLRKDRNIKTGIYAEAGVPEYWVVDIEGKAVERYTEPLNDRYTRSERFDHGTIALIAFPDVSLSVDDLFS